MYAKVVYIIQTILNIGRYPQLNQDLRDFLNFCGLLIIYELY